VANKKPWFKCYPSDWLKETRKLSPFQTGILAKLSWEMHEEGKPIDRDDAAMARLCGGTTRAVKKAVDELIEAGHLVETDDGLVNFTLLKHGEYAARIASSRAQAARRRWDKENAISQQNQREADAKASRLHMQNGCKTDASASSRAIATSEAQKESLSLTLIPESQSSPPQSGGDSPSASSLRSEPDRSKSVADGEKDFTKLLPPGGNWSKLVWDDGLPWLARKVGKQPSTIRSLVGKWQADLGKDGEALWEIFIAAQQHDPSDATAWIAGAVKDRKRRAEAGDDVQVRALDMNEDEWRAAFKSFRKNPHWARSWGPPPGDPDCMAPQQVLIENGYQSGPTRWDEMLEFDKKHRVQRA